MAEKVILADTSILIEFFRKSDKPNARLWVLVQQGYRFKVSAITIYEIYTGAKMVQHQFWVDFLQMTEIIPFDEKTASTAVLINIELKKKRKQIDLADLFIEATAIVKQPSAAALNVKHFERIDNLLLV